MIYLIDEHPEYCPGCGDKRQWGEYDRMDFHARASITCHCGALFQRVDTEELLEAAERNGGDLKDLRERGVI